MDLLDLTAESLCLANVLNANGWTLSSIKLRRQLNFFVQQIMKNIKLKIINKVTLVGSNAEGLHMEYFINEKIKHRLSSDLDLIVVVDEFMIMENKREQIYNKTFYPNLSHVLRLPDKANPGYSKLVISTICKSLEKYCYRKGHEYFLKNTVKETLFILEEALHTNLSIHGPAVSAFESLTSFYEDPGFGTESTDFVFCLKGEKWPDEASEWCIRERKSKWPTKKLMNEIITTGYFLAAVGNKESNESEIQWRVSFNEAELLLIESFNETQTHSFMFLRLFKNRIISEIAGKNVTSYSIKTLIFWCIEEKSEEFWNPSNLVHCICFCISKLKSFVEKGFLPNYFITNRNQFNSSEFTREIQTKTNQCLESFLSNPIRDINFLLTIHDMNNYTSLSTVIDQGKEHFIVQWLLARGQMAFLFHSTSRLSDLYKGHSTANIYVRCKEVITKLKSISYVQPFIRLFINYKGILRYILVKNENEKSGRIESSNTQIDYLRKMQSRYPADRTHTSLRVATCFLDNGVEEDCLKIIRTVTAHPDNHMFMQNYIQYVEKTVNTILEKFQNLSPICKNREIPIYISIIKQDVLTQDPYKTIEIIEKFKKEGYEISGCDVFPLVWERCWFDVTFMKAELQILPKPAALELCIDCSQKKINFHPCLYGLLLEFLWHEKNGSPNSERESVLEKMKNCVSMIPNEQKFSGMNFIAYCSSLQKDYCSATKYLIQSFKLNPVEQNVAYLYIKYIINLLRTI